MSGVLRCDVCGSQPPLPLHAAWYRCAACVAQEKAKAAQSGAPPLTPEGIDALRAERDKLAAFKAFVHRRLDEIGVPVDPPGEHRDAGCRIGQRIDWLVARLVKFRDQVLVAEDQSDGANAPSLPEGLDALLADALAALYRIGQGNLGLDDSDFNRPNDRFRRMLGASQSIAWTMIGRIEKAQHAPPQADAKAIPSSASPPPPPEGFDSAGAAGDLSRQYAQRADADPSVADRQWLSRNIATVLDRAWEAGYKHHRREVELVEQAMKNATPFPPQAQARPPSAAGAASAPEGNVDLAKMPPALTPAGRAWAGLFYSRFIGMGYENNMAVVLANHAADVVLYHLPAPGGSSGEALT